jgi:hypothetical protein
MRICIRRSWLVLLALLAASLAHAEDGPPTAADIERDLVLEATLATPGTIQPGQPVRVTSRIVNRSKTHIYKLVRPGDGSESGWREPHVFYRAQAVGPRGVRKPVAERQLGRCGLFDADWHKGVVSLAPGESLVLTDWMPAAHHVLDFQQSGPVELRLHYRYTRGQSGKGGRPSESPDGTGPMGNVPAFELVSAPVRFSVTRLIDIRLEVTGTLTVGRVARLSDVLRLHVENLAHDPVHVSGAEITLQLLPAKPGGPTFTTHEPIAPTIERKTPPLGGKATRTWSGRPDWDELPDWRLAAKTPGTFEVVAILSASGSGARYVSAPVEVRVQSR